MGDQDEFLASDTTEHLIEQLVLDVTASFVTLASYHVTPHTIVFMLLQITIYFWYMLQITILSYKIVICAAKKGPVKPKAIAAAVAPNLGCPLHIAFAILQ